MHLNLFYLFMLECLFIDLMNIAGVNFLTVRLSRRRTKGEHRREQRANKSPLESRGKPSVLLGSHFHK